MTGKHKKMALHLLTQKFLLDVTFLARHNAKHERAKERKNYSLKNRFRNMHPQESHY